MISSTGIRKSTSGRVSNISAIAITKLDELLKQARPSKPVEADRRGRRGILAVHFYDVPVSVGEVPAMIRLVVRQHRDGRRYYDHFEVEEKPVSGTALGE
jgi:hypothetical protein